MGIKKHILESNEKASWSFTQAMHDLDIRPEKAIMVHPHVLVHEDGYLSEIKEYIVDQLNKKGWDCKVVFFHPNEGIFISNTRFYDKVVRHLISNYSFPLCNFIYVTGAARTKSNLRLYHNICAEYDMLPLVLAHASCFENCSTGNRIDLIKKEKILKKFVCLNGRDRPHRLAIISEILKRNLRDQCFLSLALREYEIPLNYEPLKLFLSDETVSSMRYYLDQLKPLPLNLTLEENDSNMHIPNDNDIKLHNSSLFSLVNETVFFNDPKYLKNEVCHCYMMCYPAPFFTEKTWRCIDLKHPFILCSTPNSLSALRELGYKTFHPYINESYDTIENESDRILAIMDEVERLCNMSDVEITVWLSKVSEICEYNHQMLMSKQHMYSFAE